jgi:tetratricopeptide (TPR) repeat protein
MRANVLPDARLVKLAGRFAWLDVDTEKPANFAFVEKFPIEAWPTVYVIDPEREQVVLRWMGTATAEELAALLGDAERTLRQGRRDAASAELARGAGLAAERKHAEAARAFEAALRAGGPRWPDRPRAADALLQALTAAGDDPACAARAAALLPSLPRGPAYARVAAAGLACATSLEPASSQPAAIRTLEPFARKGLTAPGVLGDDRSSLHEQLVAARSSLGDGAGAKREARAWLAFVEEESRRAKTPLARSAVDGARLQASLVLGEPARAIPALEASARALPGESFAQSTLATAYLEAGRPADALPVARRAVALAEGPRKVKVMTVEAQALRALGDRDAAQAAIEAAIAHGEGLPEAVRPNGALRRARALLAEWTRAG